MNLQSQIENRQRFTSEPSDTGPKVFFLVFFLSMFCHALFFISLFFLHDFEFSAPKPKVITVDLVTFAPGPANAQIPEKLPGPDEPASDNTDELNSDAVSEDLFQSAQPTEPEISTLKPEVSLKSKPDNLKDLIAAREKKEPKKEIPKEEPVKEKKKEEEKARKKLEQDLAKAKKEQAEKLEKQRLAQLKKSLERMKASVASKEKGAQGTDSGGSGAAGVTGGGRSGEASPLTLYQMVIKSAIEQNWIFNDAMAGLNQDLEVRIFIKILKTGDIRDISFETRSGNNYLDESAKKAVQRANPLPELPKGMSSYELVLGFSPRGLK